MGGWYYINCEMYILCPCPGHPFQTRKGRWSKPEAFEEKTPLPVVKKINVKVNYWSKVRKPLIAVYLLQIIIIITCLQSCLKKRKTKKLSAATTATESPPSQKHSKN